MMHTTGLGYEGSGWEAQATFFWPGDKVGWPSQADPWSQSSEGASSRLRAFVPSCENTT